MIVEVWLVRHAETKWTEAGRFCGRSDPPLSKRGRAQARELRDVLRSEPFDEFVSSPSRRALETARLACGEPRLDGRLLELDFGDLEGATWMECSEDIKRRLSNFESFEAPAGESVARLAQRVVPVMRELGTGRHLVVTHGGVIRYLLGHAGVSAYPRPASIIPLRLVLEGASVGATRLGVPVAEEM